MTYFLTNGRAVLRGCCTALAGLATCGRKLCNVLLCCMGDRLSQKMTLMALCKEMEEHTSELESLNDVADVGLCEEERAGQTRDKGRKV